MTIDDYCREIEAHLCRRNAGHLVRVVGPAFEMVREWGRLGIPLKVATQGIDRRVARLEARGGSRRPVRVEFCEGDVLRAFDEWRRAVGVRTVTVEGDDASPDAAVHARRGSLARHIERVVARLTALRSGEAAPAWQSALEAAVRELDALIGPARKARGEARDGIVAALAAIDRSLLCAARQSIPPDLVAEATAEAARELEPFRTRLQADAWAAAVERAGEVVLRERLDLPAIVVE